MCCMFHISAPTIPSTITQTTAATVTTQAVAAAALTSPAVRPATLA